VASLRSITEIAFFDAIFLFTSSFLSLDSSCFSFSIFISVLWPLSGTVSAFVFSGLVLVLEEDEEEEGGGLGLSLDSSTGCDRTGRRLNDGGNECVGLESEAMDFSVCEGHRDFLWSFAQNDGFASKKGLKVENGSEPVCCIEAYHLRTIPTIQISPIFVICPRFKRNGSYLKKLRSLVRISHFLFLVWIYP
jgi:hypothetical protein